MPHSKLGKFFLSSIVESSHDSIITIDFNIIVTSWNKSAERLYGIRQAKRLGNL
jgi:two-component system CheB/CheR fusion protein